MMTNFAEIVESLEAEAAYLAKWVNENEGAVDTLPIEYAIQSIYEITQSLRMRSFISSQVAMAVLGDEIDD